MQVKITGADVGRVWTYDAVQVFRIQHVDGDSVKVKDINKSDTTRARMTIERLEALFDCGRAEWGDCVRYIANIVTVSGGSNVQDIREWV